MTQEHKPKGFGVWGGGIPKRKTEKQKEEAEQGSRVEFTEPGIAIQTSSIEVFMEERHLK